VVKRNIAAFKEDWLIAEALDEGLKSITDVLEVVVG
jgi:hypothetical protein